MKMMTCRQLGGPCDAKFQGKTADEILSHAHSHIDHLANRGDDAHRKVQQKIEEMQKNPSAPEAKAWSAKFKHDFDTTPNMS